ncbi:P-loop containing nucleoside triphosphate hydrolase protein [Aspergillus pseudodeflectus]|uniref:P-loop containing nucleoside triphosphate hydrolase protein n=1 Tax=Aspergillus pseudodeflectus TaxID=176178 RepID=A0ABR4KP85_9EURO
MAEDSENSKTKASPALAPVHIKCVLVGDNNVGKTSLLIRYTNNIFVEPGQYLPRVSDNYVQDLGKYHLALWDTHVLEEHDFLRARSYPDTSILLVCFSVVKRASFENVRDRWLDEISAACPGTPWVLVGMQTDLRDGDDEEAKRCRRERERSEFQRRFNVPVSKEEGRKMARKLGASGYVECSAKLGEGSGGNVKVVFKEAILASQRPRPEIKKKRDCAII